MSTRTYSLATVLLNHDKAHDETARIVARMRELCDEFHAVGAHGRSCLADSRNVLKAVNEQLRDSYVIKT